MATTTKTEVENVLAALGCLSMYEAFAAEDITSTESLLELSKDDLTELGCKIGSRNKILKWQKDPKAKARELENKGNEAFGKKDFGAAVEAFTGAISLDAQNPVLWSTRSGALTMLSEFPQAIRDANKCIELRPHWPEGHLRLGTAALRADDNFLAWTAFSKVLELEPKNTVATKGLAQLAAWVAKEKAKKAIMPTAGCRVRAVEASVHKRSALLRAASGGDSHGEITVLVGFEGTVSRVDADGDMMVDFDCLPAKVWQYRSKNQIVVIDTLRTFKVVFSAGVAWRKSPSYNDRDTSIAGPSCGVKIQEQGPAVQESKTGVWFIKSQAKGARGKIRWLPTHAPNKTLLLREC